MNHIYIINKTIKKQMILDTFLNISKITVLVVTLLLFGNNSKVNAQNSYVLNFSDTSTYDNTCGVVKPSQWSVRRDSCILYTPYFRMETSGCGNVIYDFLVNQSGNGDISDHVYIQYSINNGPWITDTILSASYYAAVHHITGSINLCYNEVIRVRLILVTDSNTEFWQIKNNDLTIVGSFETYPTYPTPLPVSLSSFSLFCTSYGTLVKWTTLSEMNNQYFTVERSSNLIDWNLVSVLNGSNNSNTIQNYSVEDYSAIHGKVYYRLKQTDFNGESKYFSPKVRQCINIEDFSVTDVYNYDKQAYINYVVNETLPVTFELFNIEGKLIQKEIEQPEKGSNSKIISSEEIKKGIYFIITTQGDQRVSNKFIVY